MRAVDQEMVRWHLGQEEPGQAERDLRFLMLQCQDGVLEKANLRIEFLEYDASEYTGWTKSD